MTQFIKRKGIQLCYPFSMNRLNKWGTNYIYAQPKYNGERAWWNGENLVSSGGELIFSVPHISLTLRAANCQLQLDGELYCHEMSKQKLRSVIGQTKELHEDFMKVSFYVFDFKPPKDLPIPQKLRFALLQEFLQRHFPKDNEIVNVPTELISTPEKIITYTNTLVNEGYEGSVIRHPEGLYLERRSTYAMKLKPHSSDVYKIVRALEGHGKYESTLGALVLVSREGEEFHVGSFKLSDVERKRLWEERDSLPGKFAKIRYIELTDRKVPPSSVFDCIVSDDYSWETEDEL